MSPSREKMIESLKTKLASLDSNGNDQSLEVLRLRRAISHLSRVSEKRFLSIWKSVIEPDGRGGYSPRRQDELTTEMHAEFTVSEEAERRHNAFSLVQMERAGLDIDDEWIQDRGLTREQFEYYKAMYEERYGSKK